MDIQQLEAMQILLAKEVAIPHSGEGYFPQQGDLVFTMDIQYSNEDAFVAIDAQAWQGKKVGMYLKKLKVETEYVPGYFAFREGPVLKQAIEAICAETGLSPALLVVDGHGTAHPRKFGVACWLGIELNLPTIGVAKDTLVPYEGTLDEAKGSTLQVEVEGELVGFVLRSQAKVKPIFVSAGHLISQENALRVTRQLSGEFRVIEPVRRADHAARAFAKSDAAAPP